MINFFKKLFGGDKKQDKISTELQSEKFSEEEYDSNFCLSPAISRAWVCAQKRQSFWMGAGNICRTMVNYSVNNALVIS